MQPYKEVKIGSLIYRTFDAKLVDESQLVWHRDEKDRTIFVLTGGDWLFQYDCRLPVSLMMGDIFTVDKHSYHRVIKGTGKLRVLIKQ